MGRAGALARVVAGFVLAFPCVSFSGSAPPGAPVFLGCLSYSGGTCHDGVGGAGVYGGYYALQRIVGANGYVFGCGTLNTSGMCASNVLLQWSAIGPGTFIARDRIYSLGRADGVTYAAFPSTGISYDSSAYASGGQWVISSPEVLEVLWSIAGILTILIWAVAWRSSGQ